MPEVCFDGNPTETQCKRKRLLNTLKTMVNHLEQDRDRVCPVPKITTKGVACECRSGPLPESPSWLKTAVCLDGQNAIPRKTKIIPARKWVPPCINPRPNMDPLMACYCPTVKRDGMPQEMCCECDCGTGSHLHIPPKGSKRGMGGLPGPEHTINDYCTRPTNLKCPTDEHHRHWAPTRGATCGYPNMCRAQCFDHPEYRDYINPHARYHFYLEKCKTDWCC